MRKMIALLVLGSSLVLVGQPAFADNESEPHIFQRINAQGSDQTVSTQGSDNSDTMAPSNVTIDPVPRFENDKGK